jgi:hypothetical protein
VASCESVRSPRAALALVDEAAAIARGARAAEALARAHANGIDYSFQVETERRRFIRIERAAEFGRRYGYGASQFTADRAFHDFASGNWPPDGIFEVTGDPDTDIYVAWVRLLEELIACARSGPTTERLAKLRHLVERAIRQDEPQWAVPWLSYAALVEGWTSAWDDLRATTDQMLSFADRTSSPERSLSLLCRGLPSAAIVLLLRKDPQELVAMLGALADVDGHAGERELLDAFVRSLEGSSGAGSLLTATTHFAERGLGLATALAAWALMTARPDVSLPVEVRTAAAATLQKAGATWLARFLPSAA